MRPGTQLVRAASMLCVLAALVPVLPQLLVVLVAAVCVLLLLAAAEAVLLRRVQVEAERSSRFAVPLEEEEEITFSLRSNARRAVHLAVRQVWPRLVAAEPFTREALLRPGEVVSLSAVVRGVSRGAEPLPPPAVALTHWRLVERIVAAGGASQIAVIPNTRAVGRLHKQLNDFILRGLGARVAPRLGKGREFDRLRDYVNDDDFRDIAWKASARHGKLIVREFRLDRAQEMVVCLDRGHRMAARVGQVSRLDHAINATLLLSYVCNRMEDRLALHSFAEGIDRGVPMGRGATQLRRVTEYLTELQPSYRFTDYLALAAQLKRGLSHRTLVMFFTVLPESEERFLLLQAVKMLTPQHLPVVIVLSDPVLDAAATSQPSDERELAQVLVARDLKNQRESLMRELRGRGALVVETPPNATPTAAVNAYLDVKRRQLL